MSNEPKRDDPIFEIPRSLLFEIGDRESLSFAQLIRADLEKRAQHHGFARRLLLTETRGTTDDDIGLRFSKSCKDRGEEMRDQFTFAESNHYVREDRQLIDTIRSKILPEHRVHSDWEGFGAALIASVRSIVTNKVFPVTTCLMGSSFWTHFVGNDDLIMMFDPETRHERVMAGYLGSMFGMNVQTDAYRHPLLRVLKPNEMMFFAPPESLGKMLLIGQTTGMTVETDDEETMWNIPHDSLLERLNLEAVSILVVGEDENQNS
jgi:hypothetical protein